MKPDYRVMLTGKKQEALQDSYINSHPGRVADPPPAVWNTAQTDYS